MKGLTIGLLAIVGGAAMAVVVLAIVVSSVIEPIAVEPGEDE
jgi:hypothetical protein